jgi:hypothetical protein
MTREVFVLEEKHDGEFIVPSAQSCYIDPALAENHQQLDSEGDVESRVVRYVPEDTFHELLLDAWSAAVDLQQHGRYTSSADDAAELRERIEALGIVPEEWIKQAEENVNRD